MFNGDSDLMINKELDKLLCLLDGKITVYRTNHIKDIVYNNSDARSLSELRFIQRRIQVLWNENKNRTEVI